MSENKILMLSTDYLPNIGGIALHIYNLSKYIIKEGYNVVIIHPVPKKKASFTLGEIESKYSDVPVRLAEYDHSPVRTVRIINRLIATTKAIQNELGADTRFNILHQHDYPTSSLAAWISPLRSKWIWTNHSSTFLENIKTPKRRMLSRYLYSAVRGVIAVSPEIQDATSTILNKYVEYIPNGVDISRFNPNVNAARAKWGFDSDDFIVVCPRRMVPKNGVIFLARAIPHIIRSLPDARIKFAFLGNEAAGNTDPQYIQQVLSELNPYLSDRVKLLGNVSPELMPEINSIADVVVIPSMIEAVSLSALEALATAKPVVATRVGGLPEVIKHNETGILVPKGSPEHLAKAIIKLYQDTPLRKYLGVSGMKYVREHYSWEIVARRTIEFYSKVLSGEIVSS